MNATKFSTAMIVALTATAAMADPGDYPKKDVGVAILYAPVWDSSCGLDTGASGNDVRTAIIDSNIGLKLCNKGSLGHDARILFQLGSVITSINPTYDALTLTFEGLSVANDDGAVNGTIRMKFFDSLVDAQNNTNGDGNGDFTCPPTKAGTVNGEVGAGCWYTDSVLTEMRVPANRLYDGTSNHPIMWIEAEGMGANERLELGNLRFIVDRDDQGISGNESDYDVDLSLNYK
jgi:hypothetical protein